MADDIALIAEKTSQIQAMTTKLYEEAFKIGLNISIDKTKTMQIGTTPNPLKIKINQQKIYFILRILWLISIDGDTEAGVRDVFGKA